MDCHRVDSLGDMQGRTALLKVLNFNMKKALGYIPDPIISTANTSLEYHGGKFSWQIYPPTAVYAYNISEPCS